MLLAITYTGDNAPDLGYLLHKNPARPQTALFSFGKAHVFYPEISERRCTAVLLLDMDPLDLARGGGGVLFDYVNDRPYVSSSFMSTAISRVYGTAMSGRCEKRQPLADTALDLSVELTMLPCRGDPALVEQLFSPLGYETAWEEGPLDERFPEWGKSRYVNLRLRGTTRLRDLLRHLYVLIPVFDLRKHYWIGEAEVDKLLLHGEGWLETHPAKELITRRYFKKLSHLTRLALDRLDNGESMTDTVGDAAAQSEMPGTSHRLNTQRLLTVLAELNAIGAQSVIDLGCGEGNLLRLLLKEKRFSSVAGTDVSVSALNRAKERLKPEQTKKLTLFQSSLTYQDKRIGGYDAAVIMEVIEHLDESRLPAFAAAVFGGAGFKAILLTTPNAEYNVNYGLPEGRFRHEDHRFEWNRAEFRAWTEAEAARWGYTVRYEDIGPWDEERGSPTQMAVFSKELA